MTTKTRRPARKISDAQRAQWDAARDTKIEELGKELTAAVASLDNETQWIELLDTISTFGAKYSANNQVLIWATCAKRGYAPRMVQSFNLWKAAGHSVVQGEKAIAIWGPIKRRLSAEECDRKQGTPGFPQHIARGESGGSRDQFLVGFKPVAVFDVAQVTDPDTVVLPEPLTVSRTVAINGPRPELLTGSDPTGALADVERLVKEEGYELRYVDPVVLGTANGRTNGEWIEVRNDVDDAQKIKTLVHEWAHNKLGHTAPGGHDMTRGRRETEAEATAYVVCGALGLDTGGYSAPYVNTWSEGNSETIRAALGNVTSAARAMLAALTPEPVVVDPEPAVA